MRPLGSLLIPLIAFMICLSHLKADIRWGWVAIGDGGAKLCLVASGKEVLVSELPAPVALPSLSLPYANVD